MALKFIVIWNKKHQKTAAILLNTPSHLILEVKQVRSWLARWWEKYQKTMKSSKLEIPDSAGSSVLSLITLENSRAGQSHCNFDFLNFTSWLMIASFSMNVFTVWVLIKRVYIMSKASKLDCLACFLFCNIGLFNPQCTLAIILSLNEHCNGFLPSCQYAAVQRMLPSLVFSDLLKCTLLACAFGI